jgi:hypothetical protein
MLPGFRIVGMVIKVFSRPAIDLMKAVHQRNVSSKSWISKYLIRWGQLQYSMKIKIDRKVFKLKSDEDLFHKPIPEDIALEKGVHNFYEFLFYFIVLSVTAIEMRSLKMNAERKDATLRSKLGSVIANLEQMEEQHELLEQRSEAEAENIQKSLEQAFEALKKLLSKSDEILNREIFLQQSFQQIEETQATLAQSIAKL